MKVLKFFGLLFVLLISFLFEDISVKANHDFNRFVDINVYYSFDGVNQASLPLPPIKYGQTLTIVTDDVPVNKEFALWIVNNRIRTDLPQNPSFRVTDNMDVKGIFTSPGIHAVVFLDTNGVVLKTQYVEHGENADDQGIVFPNKPGYKITTEKWDATLTNITQSTVVVLQYEIDTAVTYELIVNNGIGGGIYSYNEFVTISADEPEVGWFFSHWLENGFKISNQSTYSFTMLYDKNITAIYTEVEPVDEPIITISRDLMIRENFNSYLFQFYLPNNFQLIEFGVITSLNDELIDLTTPDISVKQANKYHPSTKEFVMSLQSGSHIRARGYMIVLDNENILRSVYSDNIVRLYSITFNSNGGSEVKPIYQEKNTNITEPVSPSLGLYTFIGWFIDSELITPFVFDKMPLQDLVLYAKWDWISTEGLLYELEEDDSYTVIGYDGSTNVVIVPNVHNGLPVKRIDSQAFTKSMITVIYLPEGIISIGESAFWECKSLTNVYLPSSLTSIGNYAFAGCESLTTIVIPEGITSINEGVFAYCESLETVILPEGLTSIGDLSFGHSNSLRNIHFPNGLISIGMGAFYMCTSLETVTLPQNLTNLGIYAFMGCSALNNIDFSEVTDLTHIGEFAFMGCLSLTTITIPEGVTSIGDNAFYNCLLLENVNFPSSLTSIGGFAFGGCEVLKNIIITTGVAYIGEFAFADCISLSTIIIPENVTNIGENAFYNCNALFIYCENNEQPLEWDIDWNSSNRPVLWGYSITDGLVFALEEDNSYSVIGYTGSNNDVVITQYHNGHHVKRIGDNAFINNTSIRSIFLNVPDNLTYISDGVFFGCESLTSIIIPEGVTSIGNNAFGYCSSLTSITLPAGITSIGDLAFSGCASLTSIIIPLSVIYIGYDAFEDCYELTIYCEKGEQPLTWHHQWNASNLTVVWSYSAD